VDSLEEGDIVQGLGLVEAVNLYNPPSDTLEVEFWSRERHIYSPDDTVHAFVRLTKSSE
jgi:hypothetical protein